MHGETKMKQQKMPVCIIELDIDNDAIVLVRMTPDSDEERFTISTTELDCDTLYAKKGGKMHQVESIKLYDGHTINCMSDCRPDGR